MMKVMGAPAASTYGRRIESGFRFLALLFYFFDCFDITLRMRGGITPRRVIPMKHTLGILLMHDTQASSDLYFAPDADDLRGRETPLSDELTYGLAASRALMMVASTRPPAAEAEGISFRAKQARVRD